MAHGGSHKESSISQFAAIVFLQFAALRYPAGHNTILYHADHKSQIRVFPGPNGAEARFENARNRLLRIAE